MQSNTARTLRTVRNLFAIGRSRKMFRTACDLCSIAFSIRDLKCKLSAYVEFGPEATHGGEVGFRRRG